MCQSEYLFRIFNGVLKRQEYARSAARDTSAAHFNKETFEIYITHYVE